MISTVQPILIIISCSLVFGEVCSPDDNKFYHRGLRMCRKCEKCLVGMGKDVVNGKDKIRWVSNHGATTCTQCIPCDKGYFSDVRGYTCKPCRVCSQQNRYELKQCTSTSDAVCGDVIVTTKQEHVPSVNATVTQLSETKSTMVIFVVATVGVFGMAFIFMLLIYMIWRHLRRREGTAVINNLNNIEQQLPLVNDISSKPSNLSSASNLLERNPANSQRNCNREENANGATGKGRIACRAETTPKSVASENVDETVPVSACVELPRNSMPPTTSKYNNKNSKAHHGAIKLCCAVMTNICQDDVSKSSLSSECLTLAVESITKDKNFKSLESLSTSCKDTCVLNRSECDRRTASYDTSICTDSPSYYCRCFECSLCACDARK